MSTANGLARQLRQMIAVLESERQALAALDLDSLMMARHDKLVLCDNLGGHSPEALDAECRALAQTAQQLNEVNRRVRNLLAANVEARLEALSGRPGLYRPARIATG
ncbi:MAG: flagellar protein FlgN [Novosphingobium sp.]